MWGKIYLKSNQVMISIPHYDPYLGQIQDTVESSQKNAIINYRLP